MLKLSSLNKMSAKLWNKMNYPRNELQLRATLTGGQSFRWKMVKLDDEDGYMGDSYIGVMANCVWQLRQEGNQLMYRILGELKTNDSRYYNQVRIKVPPVPLLASVKGKNSKKATDSNELLLYSCEYYESMLKAYFRMDTKLADCYDKWSMAHKHFEAQAGKFDAIRVLNQDPVENLFSFICSQNNHISRISSLVEKLSTNYGPKICEINGISYHAFPNYGELAHEKVEQELRDASFGYRAKFIQRAAAEICNKGGLEWFQKVQSMAYKDAHRELITLTGIGPKVADCICLMSLNHLEAIPVDTHVLKIAMEHYLPPQQRSMKSVTPKLYDEIGDSFRNVYGPLAGWAQTVLFCADLTKFKDKPPDECSKPKKKKKL